MSADFAWPEMDLPVVPPFAPTESLEVPALPRDEGWQFEPKWDGFRCLAFRDGDQVVLQSKSGQPLTGYFPEVVSALRSLKARRFVIDGEIVIPMGNTFSFDDLLKRIHPSESRVRQLSTATPALLLVFDLLVDARGRSLLERPLYERRHALEELARTHLVPNKQVRLSPATTEKWVVEKWHAELSGRGIDGIMAKRLELAYLSGERTMQKLKWVREADCVVGGFRYAAPGDVVGCLLLGLYDHDGQLDHVGFCGGARIANRAEVTRALEKLALEPGFTGRAPSHPVGTNREKVDGCERLAGDEGEVLEADWIPLEPALVVEVQYDHFSQGRFRHGTKLLRWRSDKTPRECTLAELERTRKSLPRSHARVA